MDKPKSMDKLKIETPTSQTVQAASEYGIVTLVPTVPTVHTVHVRRLDILQWLHSMNIPTGKPVTVQFVREDEVPTPNQGLPTTRNFDCDCDCFAMGRHNCPVHK